MTLLLSAVNLLGLVLLIGGLGWLIFTFARNYRAGFYRWSMRNASALVVGGIVVFLITLFPASGNAPTLDSLSWGSLAPRAFSPAPTPTPTPTPPTHIFSPGEATAIVKNWLLRQPFPRASSLITNCLRYHEVYSRGDFIEGPAEAGRWVVGHGTSSGTYLWAVYEGSLTVEPLKRPSPSSVC